MVEDEIGQFASDVGGEVGLRRSVKRAHSDTEKFVTVESENVGLWEGRRATQSNSLPWNYISSKMKFAIIQTIPDVELPYVPGQEDNSRNNFQLMISERGSLSVKLKKAKQ